MDVFEKPLDDDDVDDNVSRVESDNLNELYNGLSWDILIGAALDDSLDEARLGLVLQFSGIDGVFGEPVTAGDALCDDELWFDSHLPFVVCCEGVVAVVVTGVVFGVLVSR